MLLCGKDLEDFRKWQSEKEAEEKKLQEEKERKEKLKEAHIIAAKLLLNMVRHAIHQEADMVKANKIMFSLFPIAANCDDYLLGREVSSLNIEIKDILKNKEKRDSVSDYTTFEIDGRQSFIRMTRHIKGKLETPKECLIRCVDVLLAEILRNDWVSCNPVEPDFVGFDVKLCGCKVKKDV